MKFTHSTGPNPNETESVKLEDEPIFSLFHANAGSLKEVLNNTRKSAPNMNMNINVRRDDDCIIIGANVPLPLPSTSEGLIKYQNDPISDSIPYIRTVIFFSFIVSFLVFYPFIFIHLILYVSFEFIEKWTGV